MNARQAGRKVIDAAKPIAQAAGVVGAIAGFALDLVRAGLEQRAEAKRIRILDKRKRGSHA